METNLRRFPVRGEPGRAILLDREAIYYIEAEGDDSLIRTARRERYPHVEPGGAVLRICGEAGTELKSQEDFDPFWRGELPSTQDYFIEVIHSASAIGPSDRPLRISVLINPRGQAIQWVNYRDEDNRFELRYSDCFAVGTPPPAIPPMRGEPALSLRFTGSEYFQQTNLGDVYFVVGKSEEAEILSNCTSPAYPDREQPLGQHVIFRVWAYNQSGAGVCPSCHMKKAGSRSL